MKASSTCYSHPQKHHKSSSYEHTDNRYDKDSKAIPKIAQISNRNPPLPESCYVELKGDAQRPLDYHQGYYGKNEGWKEEPVGHIGRGSLGFCQAGFSLRLPLNGGLCACRAHRVGGRKWLRSHLESNDFLRWGQALEVSVVGWVFVGKKRVEKDFGRVRLGRGPLLKSVS